MNGTDTFARTAHDLGLAAWFGGTLMGAIGVNKGAARAIDDRGAGETSSEAWAAWTPANAAAIGLHLAGAGMLVAANKGRLGAQKGVASMSTAKLVLTVAALGATGYSRLIGQRLIDSEAPVEGSTGSAGGDSTGSGTGLMQNDRQKVEVVQRQMRMLQWAIPALTGSMLVAGSVMGEQQRPAQVAHGVLQRIVEVLPGT